DEVPMDLTLKPMTKDEEIMDLLKYLMDGETFETLDSTDNVASTLQPEATSDKDIVTHTRLPKSEEKRQWTWRKYTKKRKPFRYTEKIKLPPGRVKQREKIRKLISMFGVRRASRNMNEFFTKVMQRDFPLTTLKSLFWFAQNDVISLKHLVK